METIQRQDVFSKTEKWLGIPPQPQLFLGESRIGGVGISQYYTDLASWASQASPEFGYWPCKEFEPNGVSGQDGETQCLT